MTSQEIIRLIEEDLKNAGSRFVWSGRPLVECLLDPKKQRFLNSHQNNAPEELWLVFEEGPKSGEGYKVVYDEDLKMFGLAVNGISEPVLLGLYGGFVETLNSM